MENIEIVEYNKGFIIQYKGKNLWKWENPTIWEIVEEPCQIYTLKGFAESGVRSLKRYISRNFGGNYDKWESKFKEV